MARIHKLHRAAFVTGFLAASAGACQFPFNFTAADSAELAAAFAGSASQPLAVQLTSGGATYTLPDLGTDEGVIAYEYLCLEAAADDITLQVPTNYARGLTMSGSRAHLEMSHIKVTGKGVRLEAGARGGFTDVAFTENTEAALRVDSSSGTCSLTCSGCLFRNNGNTDFQGGAIKLIGGNATFTDTQFIGNSVFLFGGAIYGSNGARLTFSGNTAFINNTAGSDGGAISLFAPATAVFTGPVLFETNSASPSSGSGMGGAICLRDIAESEPLLLTFAGPTAVFRGNYARFGGGAIAVNLAISSATVNFMSETRFLHNSALIAGGAFLTSGGTRPINVSFNHVSGTPYNSTTFFEGNRVIQSTRVGAAVYALATLAPSTYEMRGASFGDNFVAGVSTSDIYAYGRTGAPVTFVCSGGATRCGLCKSVLKTEALRVPVGPFCSNGCNTRIKQGLNATSGLCERCGGNTVLARSRKCETCPAPLAPNRGKCAKCPRGTTYSSGVCTPAAPGRI